MLSLSSGCSTYFGTKTYNNLNHCEVPRDWVQIRNDAWTRATSKLTPHGYKSITRCKTIKIEKGIKMNPKTKQWGRSMTYPDGSEFWYAGLGSSTYIAIVGTPEGAPYGKAAGIMCHEVGENIMQSNGDKQSNDDRNKFLWSLGL